MNTIGPLLITSCTLYVPESGSWVLEVDHDLPTGVPAPTGKVTCLVGGVPFFGTIVPAASGVFGTRARARVVGAFAVQVVDEVPCGPHDTTIDLLLTERGIEFERSSPR